MFLLILLQVILTKTSTEVSRVLVKKLRRRTRINDLRHTTATRLVASGIDLVVVASLLDHNDIRITAQRYAHPVQENKIKAIHALDNFGSQSGLRIAQ